MVNPQAIVLTSAQRCLQTALWARFAPASTTIRHHAGAIGSLSSPQGVIRVFNFRGQKMKQLLLAGVALSVASAASAADMQARPYSKAPPATVVAAYNWSGFYVGAMGGYGWGDTAGSGGFGGGTVGYNWQFPGSQFVFGVEVDAAGASLKDSFTDDLGGGLLITQDSKINSFGSVTGRAGFAMDALLLYAKGGFAWANNKTTVSVPLLGA